MVSDPSAQSPLVLAGGGSHMGRFRPLRMTIRGSGRALIWVIRCVFWELAVLYYNMSSPLETEVPQRDFRVWPNPKRRLACPLRRLPVRTNGPRQRRRMDPRSGVKDYVRLSVFHLSSRPKWRDPSCRAVNRERGKDEKGSTKVSFE